MVKTKRFLVFGLAIMLAFAMLVGVVAPVRTVEASEEVSVSAIIGQISNSATKVVLDCYHNVVTFLYSPDGMNSENWGDEETMCATVSTQSELESILELLCDSSGNALNYEEVFGSFSGTVYDYAYGLCGTEEKTYDSSYGITTEYIGKEDNAITYFYAKASSNSGSGGSGSGAGAGVVTNTLVATLSVIVLGTAIALLSVRKKENN